jgi:TetR/AcrR family transcriptional regulator, cholesterol catabolism regulator
MSRMTKDDVIEAAGRLFAERGYHGTSMRDLGRELGVLGSSLYSHVEGKQQLLVEVVDRGAAFFQDAADAAMAVDGGPADRLHALINGHAGVVLDHRSEVRTYLDQAAVLDPDLRATVVQARDRYEGAFRAVLEEGVADGSFRSDLDVTLAAIYILSILNAVERWYREDGRLDRSALVDDIDHFVTAGIGWGRGRS